MINNKTIIENKVKELSNSLKTIGHADEKTVDTIERSLNVHLPESYKWFILKYNILLIPGFMIFGAGLTKDPLCVDRTLKYREFGLPESFVVIEDEGNECLICLDTSRLSEGECPVVRWISEGIEGTSDCYSDFYQFLIARLSDSISCTENFED